MNLLTSRDDEAAMTKQSITLFDLPAELTNQIILDLSYHEASSFRSTCKAAGILIPFKEVLLYKRATLKAALLTEEDFDNTHRQRAWENAHIWAQFFPATTQPGGPNEGINNIHDNRITRTDELTCYACLKSLPLDAFHDGQSKGVRGLGHKEHAKRFCIECGWRKKIWVKGAVMGRGAHCIVVCRFCADLNRGADALFRKERICGMNCWPKVVALRGGSEGLDSKTGLELKQRNGEQDRVPTERTCTPSRYAKCMRCWTKDHTDSPRWSKDCDFCLGCQIQLGIADMTLNEPSSE